MWLEKAVGPNDILIETWKCLNGEGVEWLTNLCGNILKLRKCSINGE